jgi:hypothetical protein
MGSGHEKYNWGVENFQKKSREVLATTGTG